MGPRRWLCLGAIALAAGAVIPTMAANSPTPAPDFPAPGPPAPSPPAPSPPAPSPTAPLHVHVSEPQCQDLSRLTSELQELTGELPNKVSTVQVVLRASSGGSVPYEVTVGDSSSSRGSVNSGGQVRTTVSVPQYKQTEVRVSSGDRVLYQRAVSPVC